MASCLALPIFLFLPFLIYAISLQPHQLAIFCPPADLAQFLRLQKERDSSPFSKTPFSGLPDASFQLVDSRRFSESGCLFLKNVFLP